MTRKNNDFNLQILSCYGIGFHADYVFTYSPGIFAYKRIVFGVDSQENNDILATGKGNVKVNNKTMVMLLVLMQKVVFLLVIA